MTRASIYFILLLIFTACIHREYNIPALKEKPLISFVNPFIGTGGHGHTYPGATAPFGMMQLSPDTRLEGWDGCSGYHYSDSYIYGFSHTHLSGTGVSDYGDILLMPTNTLVFTNGANGEKGYRAYFSHEEEYASPGFYKVRLDSTDIHIELTTTPRAGMHRYRYPSSEDQFLIIDLEHRDKLLDMTIREISDYEISGYRFSEAWAEDQRVYFHIRFSHPIKSATHFQREPDSRIRKAGYQFINPNNEPVIIRIGISAVDEEGARKNLEKEIGDKTFDQIKAGTEAAWEDQLEKIVINGSNFDHKVNFYTALYHTMIAPNLYQDVDGRYRGMDLEIHQTKEFDYYTVFSLWDTYRATHPLYTIIEKDRTSDFINTFLAKYDEGGIIPIWDLSANYTGCMIGYHAIPVIADAYLKGIRGFDAERAFTAMKHSAMQDDLGLRSFKEIGFIPIEEESESVSKTLEYAYDDWTISMMAKALNKEDDHRYFIQRAQSYKNLFNPGTKFMQGRFRNTWFSPFDPYEVNFNYTEANAWQYSLYVPQDISGLIDLMGGKDGFRSHIDNLFMASTETSGREQADITGLIGQYAHGNEPSHHMAYLYNFINEPFKTQEKVHKIITELYQNSPDGISGNEDCGQMSAWYVFSALGFYPVTPGNGQYIIGTPLFEKASIRINPNNTSAKDYFTIIANGISEDNMYIASASLNGEPLQRSYLYHDEIMNGGVLSFEMTHKPSDWGTLNTNIPVTEINEHLITPAPYISNGEVAFKNTTEVSLDVAAEGTRIFYSINDSDFIEYDAPFVINEESIVSTYAVKDAIQSQILTTQFYKIDPNINITLESDYANQYNGGGDNALIDGIRGSKDFRTGAWQGYQDTNLIAIIDLGSEKPINSIKVNFLQDQKSWIFYPIEVECYFASELSFNDSPLVQKIDAAKPFSGAELKTIQFNSLGSKGRYVKIVAKNLGDLPEWHLGASFNGKAWIFVDEIEIK